MIKNRDIIVIGIQPWDIEIGSNCKNIAIEFSRYNRVLYVNQPLDRKTKHSEKGTEKVRTRLDTLAGKKNEVEKISDTLWVMNPKTMLESINWLPDNFLYDYINGINNKRFAKAVKAGADSLGFKDFILFNDSLMFTGLKQKELLKPEFFVYYMRDYLIKNPYWRKHGLRLEPKIIKSADLVVTNSSLYADYGREYNQNSFMVGQGCDVSLFDDEGDKIILAEDMKAYQKPVIGYVGFLTSRRLDIELIAYMAEKRPQWSVVLVGPEDDVFKSSRLHDISNIYFLGSREPEDLPQYIKAFDVCMNPQIVNNATRGNYPRKIDEYLAMGKPTIGTATEAMQYFKEYVYLAESHQDYVDLIEKALSEDTPELHEKRRIYAKSHTWENNVKNIYDLIEKTKR